MPLVEVACPGCQAVLKAPDAMAGKKARCKRCNTSFRIPGAAPPDSVGDSQQLSVADPPPPVEEDIPAAMPVEDDEPLPASVAEEPPDDPFAFSAAPPKKGRTPRAEEPPAADAGDPFGFTPSAAAPKSSRKLRAPAAADDDDRTAAKKKPAGGGGLVKVAVAAAVFALVAGGVVAGVLVYINNKPGDQANNEKKDEKKLDAPPADAPPAGNPVSTTKAKDAGKGSKGTTTVGGNKVTKGSKGGGTMYSLGKAKALELPPKPADPKTRTEPTSSPVPVTVPFDMVRRLFPPEKNGADIGVAWRSAAGFQGAGEKITLSVFSPTSGFETGKVEADGDGLPDAACDLSADSGTFAIGHRGTGKVTVWDVRKKAKKLDAFDPYKDKPEHKAAKLAAVYLTEPPDRVVTVTTAGAVHVWDVATKAEAGEYVPPRAAAGKVVAGRGAAALANRQGVVVAVGGAVYSVNAVGAVGGGEVAELGGDVGKSLALAASPSGRVVYAFETDADGKKERAVAHLSAGKLGSVFRWPADAGEPTAASWSGDQSAAVTSGSGAGVVFDGEEGRFRPQAVVRAAGDKAAVAAADGGLWALQPATADGKQCVALEIALPLPPTGDVDTPPDRRPVASMLLDLRGLGH